MPRFSLLLLLMACSPVTPQSQRPSGLPAWSAMPRFLPAPPGASLCSRGNDDRVTRVFCQSPAPSLRGVTDLYRALGLDPGMSGTFVAATAHSTALGTRSVNPLNPRVIVFDGVPRDRLNKRRFVAAGFTRGEPIVELATRDETTQELRFFVVAYQRACDADGSCTLADQLLEDTESGWTSVTLFQDVDLENTALDCLRCHQPEGPGTAKLLRMQELRFPWTHFLATKNDSTTGFELARDFFTAHVPSERYGGVPGRVLLDASDPNTLSQLMAQEDSMNQPNEFAGFTINLEREATGESATWNALWAKALSAEMIPVPYWGLRVTNAAEQATVAAKFQKALIEGHRADVPELRELHTEEAERATGLRPKLGATGREVIVQTCGQCHQGKRNQTLTRARFDALRLEAMSVDERQLAIDRLRLPETDVLHMPPIFSNTLTDGERQLALDALRAP